MFTRVGLTSTSTVAAERMRTIEGRIRDLEGRIATGTRIGNPSDDPSGALRAANLARLEARLGIEQRSLDRSAGRLAAAEVAMGEADTLLGRARELGLMAANDTISAADRAVIAIEVEGLRAQLLGAANRRDEAGRFLFAGARDATAAYAPDADGRIVWVGLGAGPGAEAAGVLGTAVPTGPRLFGPDEASAFAALDALAEALEAPDATRAQALAASLEGLESAQARVIGARAAVGTSLARLEQEVERVAAARIEVAKGIAAVNGVDMTAAFAELSALRLTLSAAQTLFADIASASLFDRLG
jgi:flagellar hook-associated protein 3 FlgL